MCDPNDDGDGLSTSQELTLPCPSASGPTDPLNDDSDNDRFNDGAECLLGFDPANSGSKPALTPDADRDSLADGYETLVFGTDPNNADTDGDSVKDGTETLRVRSNPFSANTDGNVGIHRCGDARELSSINNDYAVTAGDLGQISKRVGPYPASDHASRNYDVDRNGAVNSGDLAITASAPVFGNCPR